MISNNMNASKKTCLLIVVSKHLLLKDGKVNYFQLINYFTEAKARIEGPDDKEVHVKQRSRVKLTCVVDLGRGHGQDSAAVFWYLDGKALDWLGQTGPGRGVQVINGFKVYQTYVQ